MKCYMLFTLLYSTVVFTYGQTFSHSNTIEIRILTDQKEYEFISSQMAAHLNRAMDRFEFEIEASSFKSMRDSCDIQFLMAFCNGNNDINLYAALPQDKDAQLDISYFKGNKSINLAGELKIGQNTFEDVVGFNGMLMDQEQRMAFNMSMFLTETEMSSFVKKERILEFNIGAKGDRIIELASN